MCVFEVALFTRYRYDALLQEKEELEEVFESFKQDIMLTQEGAACKEIRILKKVIKNLEVRGGWMPEV